MFHRTNRCLGGVGYVCVGRSYQNRGVTLLGYRGVFMVISNINIGFQKSLTLPFNGFTPIFSHVSSSRLYQHKSFCVNIFYLWSFTE